jgi:hypothetical protein
MQPGIVLIGKRSTPETIKQSNPQISKRDQIQMRLSLLSLPIIIIIIITFWAFQKYIALNLVLQPSQVLNKAIPLSATTPVGQYTINVKKLTRLPITMLETGIFCFATCIHPPGAAHRSTHTRDFCRNSNLRFNCMSLKAARDLNPKIMKSSLTVLNRTITYERLKL